MDNKGDFLMYRLNCNLADEIAARLNDYADRTGIPRVTIVSLALDQYLMQEEAKRKMIADMGDPVKLAEIYRVLGLPMPGDKRTKLL